MPIISTETKRNSRLSQGLATEKIWRLSHELFRADSLAALVEILFEHGETLFPFDSAVFFPLSKATLAPLNLGHLGRNIDAEKLTADYVERYYQVDPLRILEQPNHHNRALRIHDVIDNQQYHNSEIWHDFFRPLGIDKIMGLCVVDDGNPICGIGLHRDRTARPFSCRHKDRLTLIAPAIALGIRQLGIRNAADILFLNEDGDDGAEVAAWVLESPNKILRCNLYAEKILSLWRKTHQGYGKSLFPRPVQLLIETLTQRQLTLDDFQSMLPEAVSVTHPVNREYYKFTVTRIVTGACPHGREAIVVTAVRQSKGIDFVDVIQGLGLSAREKEITRMVMRGQTNKEIANTLKIMEQTVKDHLRSIFAKAGVNSRTRLVARLINDFTS